MTWCIDCGDEFHDDDTGGYNPACVCGFHCRSCHDAAENRGKYADEDDGLEPCELCGEMDFTSPCRDCHAKSASPKEHT